MKEEIILILAWIALICCVISLVHHIYMLAQEDSDIEKHAMGAILMTVCILMNMNTLITFS